MSRRAKRHGPSLGLSFCVQYDACFGFDSTFAVCRETASSYDADVSTVDDEAERKEKEDRLVCVCCMQFFGLNFLTTNTYAAGRAAARKSLSAFDQQQLYPLHHGTLLFDGRFLNDGPTD
jgi:hypothetical protein